MEGLEKDDQTLDVNSSTQLLAMVTLMIQQGFLKNFNSSQIRHFRLISYLICF